MTARSLLIRGMFVGVVAGLVGFLVARVLGESPINSAIAFESAHESGAAMPELVSRAVQSTIGLGTAVTVFGAAMGGLFALAYACVQGRLGGLGARGTAGVVALVAFLAVYLLPTLKYPANPPSIGNPDTIGHRTALYFTAMTVAVIPVITAAVWSKRLTTRLGVWNAVLCCGAAALLVTGVLYALLPGVHETPEGFPADVLWRFRVASIAIQASLYATLGLLFGALTERSLPHPAAAPVGVAAPAAAS